MLVVELLAEEIEELLGHRQLTRRAVPLPEPTVMNALRSPKRLRIEVLALDAIATKYARKGKAVQIVGLNDSSSDRHSRLTGQLPAH